MNTSNTPQPPPNIVTLIWVSYFCIIKIYNTLISVQIEWGRI